MLRYLLRGHCINAKRGTHHTEGPVSPDLRDTMKYVALSAFPPAVLDVEHMARALSRPTRGAG